MEFAVIAFELMTPTGMQILVESFFVQTIEEVEKMIYIVVGIAGMIGALSRYYLGLFVDIWWHHPFPFATLSINLIGCFAISWITMYLARLHRLPSELITAINTGFIGSFTTFSTFSVESVRLLQQSEWAIALSYIFSSLAGGLAMSWLGAQTGNFLFVKSTQKHRFEGEKK
ncbi:crcB-like family protein [Anoxybacillus sp. B7M1]|nr:crcB-like family protein [Anoxybacillus sp. B2M1]ANB64286.1 crcB-like family protein [Anoxybacillus sp. B7M1]